MEPIKRQTLVGQSPLLMDLTDQLSRLAPLDKPVLVLGERGTGKELIAERLHYLSNRWDQPFIKLNCAAMSESLLESELFGHERGAFTGATGLHRGRFERADGGTLFLDELATCSPRVQEKLLRVIEYGELERVGGHQSIQVDVRLVAATNADIRQLADEGKFRADLLDRLAFEVLHLPPLRYRGEDIRLLAEHFAVAMCRELRRAYFPGFGEQALASLMDYHWPGNVRELKNVIERSVYRAGDSEQPLDEIALDPFQPPWQQTQPPQPSTEAETAPATAEELPTQVRALEKKLIEQALKKHRYNQRDTADALGLSYHQLRAQLRKHRMLPLKRYLAAQAE
ncbi:phage shock protein operon transcriptional activator [Marinobacterium arenosum]|uniref:phage shock protein operon transcriptional activator n=1 Tax=Marinobacterium arenosum TaxID=2862496 RepID=UPI001C97D221|nr:phage shock protein operon transcriptional activator [Marinobacterium arenosum]MBY4676181.1 phage shock protein operon transcriptional activator [Marinobacterium arenosum]